MTSIGNSTRQVSNDSAYYITVGNLINKVYTSPAVSSPAVAVWASSFGDSTWYANGCYASSINAAGSAILKDMGRTVVSSGVYFRKIQLVVPQGTPNHTTPALYAGNTSTFGVAGNAPNGGVTPDYLTGYIVLGFDGVNTPAPVAKFGL